MSYTGPLNGGWFENRCVAERVYIALYRLAKWARPAQGADPVKVYLVHSEDGEVHGTSGRNFGDGMGRIPRYASLSPRPMQPACK